MENVRNISIKIQIQKSMQFYNIFAILITPTLRRAEPGPKARARASRSVGVIRRRSHELAITP